MEANPEKGSVIMDLNNQMKQRMKADPREYSRPEDSKVENMMWAGDKDTDSPWHGLGVYVGDKNVTSKQAIKAAGLDWQVSKQDLFFLNRKGSQVKVPGEFAIVREDNQKSLGVVGNVYTPLQNLDAFNFMDEIIGEGRAVYHTAGSLMGGSKIWVLVDMRESAEIVPGDEVKNFLLLSNSHDGTGMVDIGLSSIRVVCRNTLKLALSNREKQDFMRFKHTAQMQSKISNVSQALQTVSAKFKKFIEAGRLLAGEKISVSELDQFLIQLELARANEREAKISSEKISDFKKTEKYRSLISAFETSPGNKIKGVSGSLWAAVNAVTYQVDHLANSRVTSNFENVEEARLNSAWFNGGNDKKNRALTLALEFATKR